MRGNQKMTSITPKVEDLLDLKWKVALSAPAPQPESVASSLRRAEAARRSQRTIATIVKPPMS